MLIVQTCLVGNTVSCAIGLVSIGGRDCSRLCPSSCLDLLQTVPILMTEHHNAPCTTATKLASRASSLDALLAVGHEALGWARARWNGSPLAQSRMTPSGEPEMVYLRRVQGAFCTGPKCGVSKHSLDCRTHAQGSVRCLQCGIMPAVLRSLLIALPGSHLQHNKNR